MARVWTRNSKRRAHQMVDEFRADVIRTKRMSPVTYGVMAA